MTSNTRTFYPWARPVAPQPPRRMNNRLLIRVVPHVQPRAAPTYVFPLDVFFRCPDLSKNIHKKEKKTMGLPAPGIRPNKKPARILSRPCWHLCFRNEKVLKSKPAIRITHELSANKIANNPRPF